jgi:Skp family chaperone for outer membrane proteins
MPGVSFGALVLAAGAGAGFRVGFVNTDRNLPRGDTAKAAQAKLEQGIFTGARKDLNDHRQQLKTLSDKFEREAPTFVREPARHAPEAAAGPGPRVPAQSAANSRKT